MPEAVQATESGSLSVDQAIASLVAPPEEHEDAAPVEAAAETPEIEAETSPAEDPDAEPEQLAEGETETATDPEPATLDPPLYWKPEAKARFAELPPELQAVVLEQEGPREEAAAKAKQEAAETRAAAQKDIDGVKQLAAQLADFLPQAVETFRSRWGDEPDWAAVSDEQGAETAFKLKSQWEAEQRQLQKLAQAKQEADQQARLVTLREEDEKLKGTPLETIPARQEVAKYLVDEGISSDAVNNVSATEMLLARKAMLWDRAQAQLKAKPRTPAPAVKPAAVVRPGAAQAGTPQQRSVAQVANRFAQTRSVDDAVALLLSKGR